MQILHQIEKRKKYVLRTIEKDQIIWPITIVKNSLIGANAVVTKNVPEKSIMVGIPATRVGDATKGFQPYAVTDKDKD